MGQYYGVSDLLARMQHVVEFSEAPLRDVNQRGLFGNTPLKVAIVWGDIEAVGLLLDAGADLDAKNEDGYTALHWTVLFDRHQIAELLIARGASREVRNDDELTPLEMAVEKGDQAMASLLGRTGRA